MIKPIKIAVIISIATLIATACSTLTAPKSTHEEVCESSTSGIPQPSTLSITTTKSTIEPMVNSEPEIEIEQVATESIDSEVTKSTSEAAEAAETATESTTAEVDTAQISRVEIPRFTSEQSAHIMIPEYSNPALFEDMTITAEELARDFHYPIKGYITSDYGWRGNRMHTGIDIKAYSRDNIHAAFDGVVRVAMYNGAYGRCVVIRHFNGLETLYAHATKLLVDVNDEVKAGDVIALAGRTGRATGVHLHFEVRAGGGYINPNLILDTQEYTLNGKNLHLLMRGGKIYGSNIDDKEEREEQIRVESAIKYYTVRSGDSLSRIAINNRTTVSKLCKLNNITPTSIIKIGQRLRVR